MKRLMHFPYPLAFATLLLLVFLTGHAGADPGVMPLYFYGVGDGKLGEPTAFAESWMRPSWVPAVVCKHWPGVAISGLPPGTKVRMTVVGLPAWTGSWPELSELVGNTTVAYVADRPGRAWFADAWWRTFGELAPHWVGVVYVRIEVMEHDESSGRERMQAPAPGSGLWR